MLSVALLGQGWNVDFLPLSRDDEYAWAGLLAQAFGRTHEDMGKLLKWLHEGHTIIAYGAWDKGQLAAQYSCRITSLHLPESTNPVTIGMSVNMAVHPSYRGQGLIKHLSRPVYDAAAAHGAIAGVGFSNTEGVKVDLRSKSYGYQVIGKMTSTLVWLVGRPSSTPVWLTGSWLDTMPMISTSNGGQIRFLNTTISIHHRFACHPLRRYHFGVWNNQCGSGIVIYRPIRIAGVVGAGLWAAYSDDLNQLIKHWSLAISSAGMRFVHVLTTPASPLRQSLKQVGVCVTLPFTRTPYYLTVKPVADITPAAFFDLRCWDCCGGDIL